MTFGEFVYSNRGDLVCHVDGDGYRRRYTYDDDHRLTSHTSPTGLVAHFLYNDRGRCCETWCAYEDGRVEPGLYAGAPRTLADGVTSAKGLYHVKVEYGADGYSECIDSLQSKRLFGNRHGRLDKATNGTGVVSRAYDALGNETVFIDAAGAAWKIARDARGRALELVDPKGAVRTIQRNTEGRPTAVTEANGGTTTYEYDARGNLTREVDPTGATWTHRYDPRGLMIEQVGPTGSVRTYYYDQYANLIAVKRANGGVWRYEYDGFGRIVARVKPDGGRRTFVLSVRGDQRQMTDEMGAEFARSTDGRGELTQVVEPGGAEYDIARTATGWVAATRRPNGQTTRFWCDRDGRTTEVENGLGETYHFVFGSNGKVIEQRAFDGRVYGFKHDERGLVTALTSNHGVRQDRTYDERGLLETVTDQTDEVTEFTWNVTQRLDRVSGPDHALAIERDLANNVLAEHQTLDGDTITVEKTYDASGNPVRIQTSLGYDVAIGRGSMGERTRVVIDGRSVEIDYDLANQDHVLRLPQGTSVIVDRDAQGRPVRRRVVRRGARPRDDGQPQWVGRTWLSPGDSVYRWGTAELVGVDDEAGTTTLAYDASGRLVSFEAPGGSPEQFDYDPCNNPFRRGVGVSYARGGRLSRFGDSEYLWNDAGQLVEKRTRRAPGDVAVTHYRWRSSGLLGEVERPDGVVVLFRYDGLGRRVEKTVRSSKVDAGAATVERTRFVWTEDFLLQEVTTRTVGGRSVRVAQRDYCYLSGFRPLAHVDVSFDADGKVTERRCVYYLSDPFGFPEALVDERGDVVAKVRRTAFGDAKVAADATATTPLRKIGQYYDDETGLSYNRIRYYDPETGRFLSPDPLSLRGSMEEYSGGLNPIRWDDPLGLATDLSARTAQLREALPYRQSCYAVGQLSNGDVVVTRNGNGAMPSPCVRDGTEWDGQRRPGDNPPGAISQQEFQPTQGTGVAQCDHAERRMIRQAEAIPPPGSVHIDSVSATNCCCQSCHDALVAHNPDIQIADPNGQQRHP